MAKMTTMRSRTMCFMGGLYHKRMELETNDRSFFGRYKALFPIIEQPLSTRLSPIPVLNLSSSYTALIEYG